MPVRTSRVIASGGLVKCGYSTKGRAMSNRATRLVLGALLLTMAALAQNNTGIISGKITDQTGAIVPNAQVTVTQTDTGVNSVSLSNSEGIFRVPGLRDGPYSVTVSAAGFKKAVRDGLSLQIGQVMDVEMKLEVGATSESITVSGAATLLDTQTSSTGQVMEGDYFYHLPNYQHWEKGVLYYTPQVESSNAPWPGSLGNWNINGGQQLSDGSLRRWHVSHQHGWRHYVQFRLRRDEEVKVLTSAMPAEYGHATSGLIIVVKTGGTNHFHGRAASFSRAPPWSTAGSFSCKPSPNKASLHTLSATRFHVGGPIRIPRYITAKTRRSSRWRVRTTLTERPIGPLFTAPRPR